ncbi:hypothetical protein KBB74_00845 [Candidatus Parcubacteria bacterium]|nr:hypothetical protein [Candidatus Parcubacteria bacterium]
MKEIKKENIKYEKLKNILMSEQAFFQTIQVLDVLGDGLSLSFNLLLQFGWIILPFILYKPLRFIFVLYIETKWNMSFKRVLLEVKIPQHITKPLKAMENVFNNIWPIYDPPKDWRATFFEGKTLVSLSFEIAGINGEPHFYIRVPEGARKMVESAIYAQYPDVEIVEVPDYTQNIPQDIPNKDWDMWGCDFMPLKEDVYPLKTYNDFFEENPEAKDEKRLDPISSLLEIISTLKKGEQIWIQVTVVPISVKENNYVKRGKEIIEVLLQRKKLEKKEDPYPIFLETIYTFLHWLWTGLNPEKREEEKKLEEYPFELRLTPGERDVIAGIERKISKTCYVSRIRYIYLAKKTVFFGGAKGYGPSFFSQFGTQHLNGLKPWSDTITKVQAPDIFTKRRLYLRKRNLFSNYVNRNSAFDPFPGGTFILSSEELATIFHFPGIEVAPTQALKRIETKRSAPPVTLPIEE